MNVWVLFLSALLALSTASEQDLEENNQQINDVFPPDPDPQHLVPEGPLGEPELDPDDSDSDLNATSPFTSRRSNLYWQTTHGHLYSGAVSIWNSYAKRREYVCKHGCHSGFFYPRMGPYCYYPYHGLERRRRPFQLLVNRDNFALVEWKSGSYGWLPSGPLRTCSKWALYVAKNKYGLGKVYTPNKSFFLPWRGREYRYHHYEALSYTEDAIKEHISHVQYNTKGIRTQKFPPEVMRKSSISNRACTPVTKTFKLSKSETTEKRWDSSRTLTVGLSTSITAGIPKVASVGVTFSTKVTTYFSKGSTVTNTNAYSVTVTHTVPPNHSCVVSMLGYKYKADIPYTARLTRTYRDGRSKWFSISGTYRGVDVGEVESVVDRCKPIPNAQACRRSSETEGQ